jgi:hypothetical protein
VHEHARTAAANCPSIQPDQFHPTSFATPALPALYLHADMTIKQKALERIAHPAVLRCSPGTARPTNSKRPEPGASSGS